MNKNIQAFLESVIVVDTETTGVKPQEDEICEIASAAYSDGKWHNPKEAILLGTTKRIPPEASVVNGISNKMVVGKQKLDEKIDYIAEMIYSNDPKYLVGHNIQFDYNMITENLKRTESLDILEPFNLKENVICTLSLAMRLIQDILVVNYKQEYLRYYYDILTDDNEVVSHRAGSDVIICGNLLEKLIQLAIEQDRLDVNGDIGEQLVAIMNEPLPLKVYKTMPWGGHKGIELESLPTDYITNYLLNPIKCNSLNEAHESYNKGLHVSVKNELARRNKK